MSMQYCDVCDRMIDTDFNAEHFPHDTSDDQGYYDDDPNEGRP